MPNTPEVNETAFPAYADALYQALRDDPFYATLEAQFSDPAAAKAAMLAYYQVSLQDGAGWGWLGEPPNQETYGVSIWAVPLSEDDAALRKAQKRAGLRKALGVSGLALFEKIEASMETQEKDLQLANHWYLSILGVSPSVQGKGLGAHLLEPVLDRADNAGVPSYLTTFTPRNISFYKRMGFEDAGRFPEPVTGSPFHILIRAAR